MSLYKDTRRWDGVKLFGAATPTPGVAFLLSKIRSQSSAVRAKWREKLVDPIAAQRRRQAKRLVASQWAEETLGQS
jgi:hypothetical protein